MPTLSEIYSFIDSFAPFRIQDSFDNSGLCVGDLRDKAPVTSIVFALDATNRVIEEAHLKGAQLVITHHPVIFNAIKHLDSNFPYALAVKYGISCIGAHTCLDSAEYGVSDMMVDALGFENLNIVTEINRTDPETGAPIGYGAMAKCKKTTPEELAAHAGKCFNSAALRYVSGGRDIDTVACGSGACSGILHAAYEKGAQALITGDVKLDVFLEAERLGMTLIDAGHYETEAIALKYLAEKIGKKFGAECIISTADRIVRGIG